MKSKAWALALGFLMTFLPALPASASVKAGDKCAKLKATAVVSGKKYTCVKSGKKLIWNKGINLETNPKPAVSPAESQTQKEVIKCAQGGTCVVGDMGPGGGIVFYVSRSKFASLGSDCQENCRYMEAAVADISIDKQVWCPRDAHIGTTLASGAKIGSGMNNTNLAATKCMSGANKLALDYVNNNKLDWHLPSKDELNQLFLQRAKFGGFRGYYWSSSEADSFWSWYQNFSDFQGEQIKFTRDLPIAYVRPVRAF
jgi:hypothetical protein